MLFTCFSYLMCQVLVPVRGAVWDWCYLCLPECLLCGDVYGAAVFREELQSCRRTDPAILEDRQPVKIQCEDSASVIVNCSEL
jgi:hypothetical protein